MELDIEKELGRCLVLSPRSKGGQHTNGPETEALLCHPELGISITVEYFGSKSANIALAREGMELILNHLKATL